MKDRRLRITLDTNTLPLERALLALCGTQADVVITTVTAREIQGSKLESELSLLHVVPEIWVMDEAPMGVGALGDQAHADLFEKTITAITNGSFPKRDARTNLSPSQKRQMRDAMIFCTHVREERDVFVTDDKTAFGEEGSAQRQSVMALASTRIMTLEEFERFCSAQREKPVP
jgi:hypothetical protein